MLFSVSIRIEVKRIPWASMKSIFWYRLFFKVAEWNTRSHCGIFIHRCHSTLFLFTPKAYFPPLSAIPFFCWSSSFLQTALLLLCHVYSIPLYSFKVFSYPHGSLSTLKPMHAHIHMHTHIYHINIHKYTSYMYTCWMYT